MAYRSAACNPHFWIVRVDDSTKETHEGECAHCDKEGIFLLDDPAPRRVTGRPGGQWTKRLSKVKFHGRVIYDY